MAEESSTLCGTVEDTSASTLEHGQEPRPLEVPRPRGRKYERDRSPRGESQRRKKSRIRYGNQPPVQVNVYGCTPPYPDPYGHGRYQYPPSAPQREGVHYGTYYECSPPRRLPPWRKPDTIPRAAHRRKCRKAQKAREKAEGHRPAARTPESHHHAAG